LRGFLRFATFSVVNMKKFLVLMSAVLVVWGNARGQEGKVTDAAAAKFEAKTPSEFRFDGGPLAYLVSEMRVAFGVDLAIIGTVPEAMLHSVRVPKLRMGGEGARLDFRNVLNLYNQISAEGDPSMGRWIIKGKLHEEPEVIMLVASGPRGESSFKVRAFPLSKENADENRNLIQQTVEREKSRISAMVDLGLCPGVERSDLQGDMQYHRDSGILVASGGKVYVELATAIVEAFKEKKHMSDISVPTRQEPKTN
jgi:hypothetical protein